MPDLRCPVGDYVASGPSEAEAALVLAGHLLKAHCRADGVWLVSQDQLAELSKILSDVPVE